MMSEMVTRFCFRTTILLDENGENDRRYLVSLADVLATSAAVRTKTINLPFYYFITLEGL